MTTEKKKGGKQLVPLESEQLRLQQKCRDLQQRILNMESQNSVRALAVARATGAVRKLQYEYGLLLEVLERKANHLPITDLKSLEPRDINANFIESLTVEDLLSVLSHSSVASMLSFQPLAKQDPYLNNISTKGKGKKRPASGHSNLNANGTPKKKARDPREPKRPTNAYLFFCDSERDRVKNEWLENHPGEHVEMSKALTEAWKSLSDEDKKPFYELYEKDKLRYHKAVEEFAHIKEQERLSTLQSTTSSPALEADVSLNDTFEVSKLNESHPASEPELVSVPPEDAADFEDEEANAPTQEPLTTDPPMSEE
ncbi:Nhp10 protein [Martiniozyma asiatica (nom. inval.)]|nr:Nhp10 protein [Martiniozyma asiatica]